MFKIRHAIELDKTFWFSLDEHISKDEFMLKIRDKRGYIICDDDKPIGIMRYNLFWDNTPFLNSIGIVESHQGQGFGTQAMKHWESEMQSMGHSLVMTSTQADEQAQHFYRKLGYRDSGCLLLRDDPAEIFFVKYFEA